MGSLPPLHEVSGDGTTASFSKLTMYGPPIPSLPKISGGLLTPSSPTDSEGPVGSPWGTFCRYWQTMLKVGAALYNKRDFHIVILSLECALESVPDIEALKEK